MKNQEKKHIESNLVLAAKLDNKIVEESRKLIEFVDAAEIMVCGLR